MFSVGALVFYVGYAMIYTGWSNLAFGFQGPKLSDSLGISSGILQPSPTTRGGGRAGKVPD
jgi:hypothetical protein